MPFKPTHGQHDTPEYWVWHAMRQRCSNPRSRKWARYGERGISVCARWQKFENFIADMGQRPPGRMTLDRVNNDGNYEPGNCRWATMKEQGRNIGRNILLTHNGETKPLPQWCDELGIAYATAASRYRLGLATEKVLSQGRLGPGGRPPKIARAALAQIKDRKA